MTGFGKEAAEVGNKKFSVEIKSLNSKQLDLNVRMPGLYKEKDLEVRTLASKKLERGKVDISIFFETLEEEKNHTLNAELVKQYFTDVKAAAEGAGMDNLEHADYLSIVMKMPEIMKTERAELDEEEWKGIRGLIEKAMDNLIEFRTTEGANLSNDFDERINTISSLLEEIEGFEDARMTKIKERIEKHLNEYVPEEQIDRNRFEQETIYYLEKLDITEEKVRLKQHCKYFLETMASNDSQGKKLGFISQEIGREINTIGSKANDADIQQRVVLMKDELEKIKEQVLNVL